MRASVVLCLSFLLFLDCSAAEQRSREFGLWGRTISNGSIKYHKPFGFIGKIGGDGTIEIGMAEVQLGVSVYPMRSDSEIKYVNERIELFTSLYGGASTNGVETIDLLGAIKGHGMRSETVHQSRHLTEEHIVFITEGSVRWCIIAWFDGIDKDQRRTYDKIVSSIAWDQVRH